MQIKVHLFRHKMYIVNNFDWCTSKLSFFSISRRGITVRCLVWILTFSITEIEEEISELIVQ